MIAAARITIGGRNNLLRKRRIMEGEWAGLPLEPCRALRGKVRQSARKNGVVDL
jgi:hypothetical protein